MILYIYILNVFQIQRKDTLAFPAENTKYGIEKHELKEWLSIKYTYDPNSDKK